MSVKNPRFPHWCRILRKATESPLEDEKPFSPLDDEEGYSPLDDEENEDSGNDIAEESEEDSSEDEDTQETVIYEGECRSYEKNTTSDKGEVITSYRGLALPLNQDGWDERGVVPQEGDEVIVVHGTFEEYGRVIDKNVATASFAGTHVIWRYGRN